MRKSSAKLINFGVVKSAMTVMLIVLNVKKKLINVQNANQVGTLKMTTLAWN